MKKVVISRKHWTRGGIGELRTPSGQSCCLGFVARAYGLKTPIGSALFSGLAKAGQDVNCLPKVLQPIMGSNGGIIGDSKLHDQLTDANDSQFYRGDAKKREEKITKLLAKAGIKAVFED